MIPVLPLTLTFSGADQFRAGGYMGSLWRSAFGATLRRVVCVTGAPTCSGCPLIARCAYGYLYDTPQPARAEGLAAQYETLPHPYILSPSSKSGAALTARELAINLTLIGPAYRFLPEVLAAARQLTLGNTRLTLETIDWRPPDDPEQRLDTAQALDLKPFVPRAPVAPNAARLVFMHPLRIRRHRQYLGTKNFSFEGFVTALLRRITLLHALRDPVPLDFDARALAAAARGMHWSIDNLEWHDLHRRSARQQRKMPMGGVTGSIDIAGSDLAGLWPWLWLGQWLHVGKLTTMGLGRYRLAPAQAPRRAA